MKKALILIVLIVTPTMAFAQGTVAFQNQTGLVRQWTSPTDNTLVTTPQNGGYVELICAPAGTPLPNPFGCMGSYGFMPMYSSLAGFVAANPGWSFALGTPAASIIGFGAGLFYGGTLTIPGIPPGGSAQYMVVGWTGAFPTYEAAWAANVFGQGSFIGVSAIDYLARTGDPTATPPGTPVSLRPTFTGITLGTFGWDDYFGGFTTPQLLT
jgi:hypothetical protein